MGFSLFYFADDRETEEDRYRLLMEGAPEEPACWARPGATVGEVINAPATTETITSVPESPAGGVSE